MERGEKEEVDREEVDLRILNTKASPSLSFIERGTEGVSCCVPLW